MAENDTPKPDPLAEEKDQSEHGSPARTGGRVADTSTGKASEEATAGKLGSVPGRGTGGEELGQGPFPGGGV